jgi:hypothetical protein
MRRKSMRNLKLTLTTAVLVVLTTIVMPGLLRAQEAPKAPPPAVEKAVKPLSVYRLEFAVREVEDGKRLNSRTYVMSVQDGSTGSIRVGNRVPYSVGKDQFQFYDVGINIDCRLREHENNVLLDNTSVEISSIVKDESPSAPSLNPVVRQARARVDAAVTPGKPTLVTALDDVSSNRRYEVEVTATKVK